MAVRSVPLGEWSESFRHPLGRLFLSRALPARLLSAGIVDGGVLLGVAALLGVVLVLDSAQLYQKDFLAVYVLGRAVAAGADPYATLPTLAQQYVGVASDRFPHASPHPPTLGLLVLPLTSLPYEAAAAVWLGLSLMAFFASIYLLCRTLGGPARWGALALAVAGLAWQPVRADLGFGNVNCVLLLLLTGTWLAARRGRAAGSGALLGLSLLIKPILGPVLLLFLIRRHWSVVGSCVATVGLGYAAALAAIGPSRLARYPLEVLPAVERYYLVSSWNVSAWTIGWRTFHGTVQSPAIGGVSGAPLVASPAGVAVTSVAVPALVLLLAGLATRRLGFDWSFGLMAGASVLISPTSWIHYLMLATPAVALTVSWLVARQLPWRETTLALAVGALLWVPDYDWARLALLAAGQVDSSRRDVGDVLHPLAFAPALLTAGPTLALGLFMLLVWTLGRQASHRGLALAAESPTWGPISRAGALDRAVLPRAADLPTASDPPAWAATAGVETLRRMASVDQYNRWIFQALGKHIGTRILEVGCGIGNMTPFFLDAEDLTCIDVAPESVDLVRRLFAAHPQVSAVAADVADPAIVGRLGPGRYDTAVCINVLEHVEADAAALRNLRALLRPGGKLVLFVPAGQYLYGRLDEALGHYRRYTVPSLRELARAQGLDVIDAYYMNVAGVPGWFLSSRLLKREAPPRGLLWLFNLLTPPLAWTEEKLRPPFGLSVVCIAQRPEASPSPTHTWATSS